MKKSFWQDLMIRIERESQYEKKMKTMLLKIFVLSKEELVYLKSKKKRKWLIVFFFLLTVFPQTFDVQIVLDIVEK